MHMFDVVFLVLIKVSVLNSGDKESGILASETAVTEQAVIQNSYGKVRNQLNKRRKLRQADHL